MSLRNKTIWIRIAALFATSPNWRQPARPSPSEMIVSQRMDLLERNNGSLQKHITEISKTCRVRESRHDTRTQRLKREVERLAFHFVLSSKKIEVKLTYCLN